MIGGETCRVARVMKTKDGKLGSAKAIIAAVDLSDDKKVEKAYGIYDLLDTPVVKKTEYAVPEIKDDLVTLQSDSVHTDLKLSEQVSMKEVSNLIKENYNEHVANAVTIMSECGQGIPAAA